jgi:hypothetical protein
MKHKLDLEEVHLYIDLCICGLFDNTISSPDYISWNTFASNFFMPKNLPRAQRSHITVVIK